MQTPPFHPIVCLLATLLLLTTLSSPSHAFWSQQRPQQQHAKPDVRDSNDQTSYGTKQKNICRHKVILRSTGKEWDDGVNECLQQDSFARDDFVFVEEMNALQYATDALKAYDSKPDCFKDAARALRQGCKGIDVDEDEKTRYAIRLTACEIATANMPIPQECHSFASAEIDSNKQPTTNDISRCVQSLGRVPQLWTSYSGYFREVKVMCLAARHSLEHDELRSLQRNLSRTHSDQIRLLNEHQRVLKEINRLETKHRKQLSDLHSTIAAEVNSMLNSAGTLKDALRSVTEEVSKLTQSLERGALQQSEALSTTQESNARILAEYQNIVHSTLASISQSMRHWDDSLERGLSRVQEIDRLNQVSIAKIAHSNEAIDSITRQAAILKVHLQNLTHLSHESTTHLLDLHVTGTQNIDISTQQLLHSTLQSLQTLSSQTHTTWSSILDKFKDDTEITMTEFRTDVAEAMKETVEEIEQVAKESTENVERLSGDLEEFWRNQENALGRVRPLLGTWDIVRRVLESQSVMIEGGVVRGGGGLMVSRMGSGFMLLFFAVITVLTLIAGLRIALIPMVASVVITIICERWKLPTVSFIHLFIGIVCFRWGLYSIRSWRYCYNNRHQFPLWQLCTYLLDRWRDLRKAQKDDAVEQEQEKEYEYGVGDEYEDGVYKDEYAKSYLDMDSAEERDVWQQPDDDILERRAAVRYNKFTSPSTPAPSTVKPKRQYQYRSLSINHKPLTKPSVDMDMDMWERVAASWDLGLGTCVSSSSTKGDIY